MTIGALDGIIVADFSRVVAGPYAAMTLGDLGATVIKVERPGVGDDTRQWGPPWVSDGDTAAYFDGVNRNKLGITLDLDAPEDLALATELVRRSDVLIENFRPGTLDRFGLGYEAVRSSNAGLVYCSITGFGRAVDTSRLPAYDLTVQAAGGLMSITGDDQPTKVGVAVIDHVCALQATVGVLAALHHRNRTGEGQLVEVSLLDSSLAALLNQAAAYLTTGRSPTRTGNRHPSIAPYQSFAAADGDFVVACGNDAQFVQLCITIGQPAIGLDARFATNSRRVQHVDLLEKMLADSFTTKTVAAWVEALTAVGVPCAPVNDLHAAFQLAADLGAEPTVTFDRRTTVRSPVRLSGTPTAVRRRSPELGEHDHVVKRWLLGAPRQASFDLAIADP